MLGLPDCPGSPVMSPGNEAKTASQASCATWDPVREHRPAGLRLVRPPARAAERRPAPTAPRPAAGRDPGPARCPGCRSREARRAAAALAAAAPAGCGGSDGEWRATAPARCAGPTSRCCSRPRRCPGDRILTGTLRNDSVRRVRVDLPDVRVLASNGDRVDAAPVFLNTFGKSLWSPGRGPEQMPDSELRPHRPDRVPAPGRDGAVHGRLARRRRGRPRSSITGRVAARAGVMWRYG